MRNSGATAVVEGVGDHGCEYMTGGRVAVLGGTGKNFAAGMSGGVAYVLDMENDLYTRVNKEMVHIEHVTTKMDVGELKSMIEEHVANTNSELGKKILDNFTEYLPKFKKIIPIDYEKMLTTILQMEEKGMSSEQAKMEAFYAIKERKIGEVRTWEKQQDLWIMTDRISLAEDSKERIKHFKEFHTPLSKEEQELQGARCMACGVPFCQSGQMLMGMASGCPLHNLVPEWNDLIFHGTGKRHITD